MRPRVQCQASRLAAAASTSAWRCSMPMVPRCAAPVWGQFSTTLITAPRQYATAASVASILRLPDDYVPPTKPPSARRAEERKAQLLRTYTSLLRSTPLMLIFQHNNLTAAEWAAIRRELKTALTAVPPPPQTSDGQVPIDISSSIQLQVARTRTFDQALKVTEFFDSAAVAKSEATGSSKVYTHDLSMAAYQAVKAIEGAVPEDSAYAQLAPLMVGRIALLSFPAVSPQHLAAALSILSPSPPAFPAPTRRKSPGYYDLTTQSGLQKLLLLGGRIESKAFDFEGVRWVGGIEGGLDGLRAQLVAMLQNAGLGLMSALGGTSKSLWITLESRRLMLEDDDNSGEKKEQGV